MKKYIIRSTEREHPNCYFVAIHGWSPFFSTLDKAKQFDSEDEARVYARSELFTGDDAFSIETTYQAL